MRFQYEINFNGSDRSYESFNVQAPLHPCLYKYRSVTLYTYTKIMVLAQA